MTRTQYRLTWQRKDREPCQKIYANMKMVEKRLALMGPEPWKAIGKDPDACHCCSSPDCGCDGITVREYMEEVRKEKGWTPVQWVKIEARQVTTTPWNQIREEGAFVEPSDGYADSEVEA